MSKTSARTAKATKASAKNRKADKAPRTVSACQCFSVESYRLNGTEEDGNNLGPVYESCGRQVLGTFAQGHDAKLKSVLQWSFTRQDGGDGEYRRIEGGMLISADPMIVAAERGWERFLLSAQERAAKKAQAKTTRTARKVKADTKPADRMQVLADMKAAAKIVKEQKLTDEDGKPLQVTGINYQSILDGNSPALQSTNQSIPAEGPQVGQEFKINYRGTKVPATVIEIKGSRAKVEFVQKTTGKVVSRVVELDSLR